MGTNITGIGNANAIGFKSRVTGGTYFPPELKDALVGVWSAYGKSNDSTDRNIIKNKIKDRGGDFVISNAAFKLNSGFGKYETELSNIRIWIQSKETTSSPFSSNYNGLSGWIVFANTELTNSVDMPSFKIQVKGLLEGQELIYRYYDSTGQTNVYSMTKDGKYTLPADVRTAKPLTSNTSGFQIVKNETNTITITQIPSFEGAFVTDGIDDLITSTKTVQEMGITDEITVVSMIHKISSDNNWTNLIGELKEDHTFVANRATNTDKTGIYGYTYNYVGDAIVINNILGDKNDYIVRTSTSLGLDNKYYVAGFRSAGIIQNISQVAWYWTFIANRVLTTDEINQVIAYYNLDRTLRPDILCNITKQGITNDNHADFNDKLIDYSGNGRDIQMNNLAWKGGSGIAAKPFETIKDYTILSDEARQKLTIYNEFSYKVKSNTPNHYWIVQSIIKDNTSYQVTIITDKDCYWINSTSFINNKGNKESIRKEYPVKANTPTQVTICGLNEFEYPEDIEPTTAVSYVSLSYAGEVTVTFIPSCKGGLLLDGVNDFGKVTGMPIYKDYTVVADYERLKIDIGVDSDSPILSKSESVNLGAFMFNTIFSSGDKVSYSFGRRNIINADDTIRKIFYQSKYINDGQNINIESTFVDSDKLWLGTYRDSDYRFIEAAIYSLMSFPYSMSEFLIERQLKKHKLGTLYPNMVEFRPVIKSNTSYDNIVFYYKNEKVENGTYLTVGSSIGMHIRLSSSPVNEIKSITVNGIPATFKFHDANNNIYQYDFNLTSKSPQKIDITIDEYIRYEDIVQPYPVIFQIKDRNTNQIYSWGDRIKIGSSIQLIHGENPNLLPELYSIISYTYEGNSYSYNQLTNLVITVTKTISVSCQKTWKLGSNEPKCILSPKRLKLANSSYKYLGYIPDISGNGNNGVFNNFAFSGMSGANGYTYEYTNTSDFSVLSKYARTINSEKIEFFGYTNAVTFYRKNPTYKGKIKIEGLTSAISSGKVQHFQIYTNSKTNTETSVFKTDGVYDIDVTGIGDATNVYFYVLPANTSESGTLDNPITIEQVGNYEGAICFDGIDDYVTIPTLSKGGKQVLMKVNWNTINSIIYDQRGSGGFAIYCSDYNNPSDSITVPAYKGRNAAGTTYIDGIRNEYIIASQLRNVTHNIVEILDTSYVAGNINPIIGKSYLNANYGKMSLYDFVLFDEVSTDEEIKQLNDIIGIEGDYVQKPDYYWDAYGKTNSDADRDTIQQRGIAVGDYDLTNTNFAYDKMSGFGGYTLGKFTNSWSLSNNSNSISIVARNPYDITLKKLGGNSDWEFNTTELKLTSNPVSVKFKSDKNIRFTCDYHYYTVGGNSEGAPLGITSKDLIANEDTIITISPISQENIDKYNIDINRGYYLIYFQLSPTLAVNEEVTIEMLPLYPNGLVYDGVDDYSENTSIPAFTDYTYIFKRTILNIPSNGATLLKGSHKTNGGAFIADYGNKWQFNFGQYNTIQSIPDGINWQTSSSFNGTSINRGTNTDDEGITVSRFSNGYTQMVFYKLMLYPRTTDMLTINMIKNMMAEDGIIDIQGKLFTDKFTGDFNLDFNKDFLIGN